MTHSNKLKFVVSEEFEDKVFRFVVGMLAEYGKPLSELTELQKILIKEDAKQLARAIIYEGRKERNSSEG